MGNFLSSLILIIILISSNSATSSNINSGKSSSNSYKMDDYKPGILIIRVKTEFRSAFLSGTNSIPQLNKVLTQISAYDVKRKFPKCSAPSEKVNKYGHKLIDLTLVYQIKFSPVIKIEQAIELVKSTGIVEYAEPLFVNKMDFIPNDPSVASQYQIAKISAYAAWDVWKGDTNVVIGIVDSGTDWDHPDLEGNIKYNYADPIDSLDNDNDGFLDNFRGWDVSEDDNNPMVVSSLHGSHVSGCASAVTNNGIGVAGPAYNCKFLPVKSSLDASATAIDDGYDGIVYSADHGANVINCSWGRAGTESNMEQDVIDYATNNKDALVVAAAGNNGQDQKHYPASYENVVSVAATKNTDSKASFSNFNETVDVCAPGDNILATYFNNSYSSLDGTSM